MHIKHDLKQFLIKSGTWYAVDLARFAPSIMRWLAGGATGVAPHPLKMMVVQAYMRRYGLRNFVETGTYLGDTLGYVARTGATCTSIELSRELHAAAAERFRNLANVKVVQGDSGVKLPRLLENLDRPTLFWLDGHYSAGITAGAGTPTPISRELEAILAHSIRNHVILIDDAHLFDGSADYPALDELLRLIRANGKYMSEVSLDIIRLTPVRA